MYFENIGRLVYANITIMLVFTVTNAGRNILYSIYTQNGFDILSPLQYVANYLIGPIALLFVDPLLERFSFKVLFFVSAFNFNLFLVGGLMVSNCEMTCNKALVQSVTIITSIIAGFLQTLFYVTFVTYINYLSNDSNKKLYYGLSFSITSIASILANVMGYYLEQSMTDFNFYLTLFILSLIVQCFLLFVKDERSLYAKEIQVISQAKQLYSQIILDLNYRMLFCGSLLFGGMMNSVLYVFMPYLIIINDYPSDQISSYIYLAFLVAGVGQIIAGLTSGKLSEYLTEILMLYITFTITLIGFLMAQLGLEHSTALTLIGCFCIGYTDSALSSLNLIVITKQISTTNHAFAGYNLSQSLGNGLASIWWAIFNTKAFKYDIYFLYSMTLFTAASVYFYQRHRTVPQFSTDVLL